MKFVDRRDELDAFCRDISQTTGTKKAVILHSPQGLGKSSLTREISAKCPERLVLRVATSFSSRRVQTSGKHYHAFMIALQALYEKRAIPSMIEFLKRRPRIALERLARALLKEASKWDPITSRIHNLAENLAGLADRDLQKMFSFRNNEVQIQVKKYLEEAFDETCLLVIVENMHSSDEYFIDFLYDFVVSASDVYVILEFTDGIDVDVSPEILKDEFEMRGVSTEVVPLAPLPSSYAMEIVSSRDQKLLAIICRYYEASDGNLRPLQDLSEQKSDVVRSALADISEDSGGLERITVRAFQALDSDEHMLLALVTVHDGEAPVSWLRGAIQFTPASRANFSEVQQNLKGANFVTLSEERCRLGDDVGLRALEKSGLLDRYEYIALDAWRRFYTEQAGPTSDHGTYRIPDNERILRLAQFLNQLDDQAGLLQIIDDVITAANESGTPGIYLDPIIKWQARASPSRAWRAATIRLVDSCLDFGMYESAIQCLERLKVQGMWTLEPRLRFALASLKDGRPEVAMESTASIRVDYEDEVTGDLGALLSLIDLMSLYYKSNFLDSFKIFQILDKEAQASSTRLSALIRRNSIMFHECNRTIPVLRQCLDILTGADTRISAPRVQLALAAELAKSGAFIDASQLLNDAEKKLVDVAEDRIVIMSNREAAKLLQGASDLEAVGVLDELLSVASRPYQECIVLNNLLLSHILLDHRGKAGELADRLVAFFSTDQAVDDQNLWASRRNIAFIAARFECNADHWLDRMRRPVLGDIPKHHVCRAIDEDQRTSDGQLDVLFSRPYRPIFFYHWGFEFSDLDLEALAPGGRA